jgi:hypothetical protein
VISTCRRYRYALWRRWDPDRPTVLFVGLNPSIADARHDDPTLRRCLRFAQEWGFGALAVGNLFAFRATDPKRLTRVRDPIGPRNDAWLRRLRGEAAVVVAAWGNGGRLHGREGEARTLLGELQCLGTTARGCPGTHCTFRRPRTIGPWVPNAGWS